MSGVDELIRVLKSLPRQVIFVLIAMAVAIPLLRPWGLPLVPGADARRIYDFIQGLEAGSVVLVSFDYDPGSRAEVHPMARAILHHCLRQGHRLVVPALWPQGVPLATALLDELAPKYGKKYGEDYVVLGYFAGPTQGLPQVLAIMTNLHTAFPQDVRGTKIGDVPLMKGVRGAADFAMVVTLSAGDPGVPAWVGIAHDRYGKVVAAGATAVQTPNFLPFVPKQLLGILGGLAGAADYEALVGQPGVATSGMDAQSAAHVMIILFIFLSNLTYLYERAGARRRRGGV